MRGSWGKVFRDTQTSWLGRTEQVAVIGRIYARIHPLRGKLPALWSHQSHVSQRAICRRSGRSPRNRNQPCQRLVVLRDCRRLGPVLHRACPSSHVLRRQVADHKGRGHPDRPSRNVPRFEARKVAFTASRPVRVTSRIGTNTGPIQSEPMALWSSAATTAPERTVVPRRNATSPTTRRCGWTLSVLDRGAGSHRDARHQRADHISFVPST